MDPIAEEHMSDQWALELEERIDHALGRGLTSLRKHAGLSITSLAERSGFPVEELIDYENGTLPIPLSRAMTLAVVLGGTLNDLLAASLACTRGESSIPRDSRD